MRRVSAHLLTDSLRKKQRRNLSQVLTSVWDRYRAVPVAERKGLEQILQRRLRLLPCFAVSDGLVCLQCGQQDAIARSSSGKRSMRLLALGSFDAKSSRKSLTSCLSCSVPLHHAPPLFFSLAAQNMSDFRWFFQRLSEGGGRRPAPASTLLAYFLFFFLTAVGLPFRLLSLHFPCPVSPSPSFLNGRAAASCLSVCLFSLVWRRGF